MKKFLKFAAPVVALAMLLGACSMEGEGSKEKPADSASVEEKDKNGKTDEQKDSVNQGKVVIGLSMNTLTNPFFVTVKEGCEKAAKELGVELLVTDAQDSPETQQKDMENLITKKPAAIIVDPCDSDAIVSSVEACNSQNIPVFTMDREAKGGEVVAHIGYDAIKSGNMAGQFLVDALGGKGNIVELQGIMGTNVAQNRSQGFHEIMDKNPEMKIVASQVANFDRAQGMKVMENILQANPQIDGLYAANDEMLLGALEAIEAVGRKGEIKVVGCDALDETMSGIRDGKIEATIAEPPFFLGKAMVENAVKFINGEKVEKRVILENQLVTKENVEKVKTRE